MRAGWVGGRVAGGTHDPLEVDPPTRTGARTRQQQQQGRRVGLGTQVPYLVLVPLSKAVGPIHQSRD